MMQWLRLLGRNGYFFRRMRRAPRFHRQADEQQKQNHAEDFLLFPGEVFHGRQAAVK